MFSLKHFIWIGLSIIFIIVMSIISKKKKFSLKLASLIMVGICILSEISKMFTNMIESEAGGMALNPRSLPFHLCSLMLFVVFYICFAKDGKLKQLLMNFLAVMGTIGSFCAILIPTNGVQFNDIGAYQCFVYHAGLMWFSIYLIISKNANLGFKSYVSNLITISVLVLMMIYVNGALSAYNTNFFYVVRPPMKDLPILNLNHGWYVYFLTLVALGITLISLFHLPFIIKERKEKKEKLDK